MEVQTIAIHPKWDRTDQLNDIFAGHDIALLKMRREVASYNSRVVPICLPDPVRDRYLLREDTAVEVAGFGLVATSSGSTVFPDLVQSATLSVMDNTDCSSFWPQMKGNQICALGTRLLTSSTSASTQLVADSCNGDSGGGLTATNFNGREVLLGVISFGEPECGRRGGKPGVYTNVADQLTWLRRTIAGESGDSCLADTGKPCVFPFTFRNQRFSGCTAQFDDTGRAWCSTLTTASGEHVAGQGEWGYCSPACPLASLAPPITAPPSPAPPPSAPPPTWSSWSQCSASCGRGLQIRTSSAGGEASRSCRDTPPCPAPSPAPAPSVPPRPPPTTWTSWSVCSATCGGGTRLRRRNDGRLQSQECGRKQCGGGGGAGGGADTEVWLLGGDGTGGSVERLVETSSGRVCSAAISSLPNTFTNHVAGWLAGRVWVCGGNSGTDPATGLYTVHNQCYTAAPARPRAWSPAPPMPANTTNAAYAVHEDSLYVFGGYQKPACGARPGVQVLSAASSSWTWNTKHDPPFELGAYQCAVTAGDLIFVVGGWYPHTHYPGAATCKEDLSSSELTAVNKVYKYFQERVQVYDPRARAWHQGPPLNTRRRKHGCGLVRMRGRYGIMAVGGLNSRDLSLRSVEWLDLGPDLAAVEVAGLGPWARLPDMPHERTANPVVVEGGEHVYVVGGERFRGDESIQRFSKKTQTWDTVGYNTRTKRKNFTFVKLPKTSNSC